MMKNKCSHVDIWHINIILPPFSSPDWRSISSSKHQPLPHNFPHIATLRRTPGNSHQDHSRCGQSLLRRKLSVYEVFFTQMVQQWCRRRITTSPSSPTPTPPTPTSVIKKFSLEVRQSVVDNMVTWWALQLWRPDQWRPAGERGQ